MSLPRASCCVFNKSSEPPTAADAPTGHISTSASVTKCTGDGPPILAIPRDDVGDAGGLAVTVDQAS
jgi:hypothetical protein